MPDMKNPAERSPYVLDEQGVWRNRETGAPAKCQKEIATVGGFKLPCSLFMGHKGECA